MSQSASSLPTVALGRTGPTVSRIALGCMGLSGMYGQVDDAQGIATIQHAVDSGITLLDTGDFYGMGHNELLISRALAGGRRGRAQLSVKFGALRDPGHGWIGIDTRPAAVKNFAAYSLQRLGLDHIDVYRPARLDPAVPIEETVGAVAELVAAGFVGHLGLSEVGAETVRRAAAVHPVVDLQIEYSIASRGPEDSIFPALREVGASATLYSVFGRGLLTGSRPTGAQDFRGYLPRFRADNSAVVAGIAAIARELDRTPAQVLLGWVLARQPELVPVIGAKRPEHVDEALVALESPLDEGVCAALEALAGGISGTRYDERQMQMLDSER
ncbi:MAG: aldo/keto reductase [Alphaproteobacteria bacterium]|nr:aldo/keto reductase [Alphaproteobacteria bacterium]